MWVDVCLPADVGIHLCFVTTSALVFQRSVKIGSVRQLVQFVKGLTLRDDFLLLSSFIPFNPSSFIPWSFNFSPLYFSLFWSCCCLSQLFHPTPLLLSLEISHVDIPMSSDTGLIFFWPFKNQLALCELPCALHIWHKIERLKKRHKWREWRAG